MAIPAVICGIISSSAIVIISNSVIVICRIMAESAPGHIYYRCQIPAYIERIIEGVTCYIVLLGLIHWIRLVCMAALAPLPAVLQ